MRNIGKIKEIGSKLPYGAKIKISKDCGISRSLVTQFFKGARIPSNSTVKKILTSTAKILKNYEIESHHINTIVNGIDIKTLEVLNTDDRK